jgi:hypothetical protein
MSPPLKDGRYLWNFGTQRLHQLGMLYEDDAKRDLSVLTGLLEGDGYCFVCTEEPHLT